MSENKPFTREQFKQLALVHEKAGDALREKRKKAESEAEKDALLRQAIRQYNKAIMYNDQAADITLTLATKEAKKLLSLMAEANKRLKKIEKVDDLVYYSGRILQAAALLSSAPVGGAASVIAAIEVLFGEADKEAETT